jgi:hypothetical protein
MVNSALSFAKTLSTFEINDIDAVALRKRLAIPATYVPPHPSYFRIKPSPLPCMSQSLAGKSGSSAATCGLEAQASRATPRVI